LTAEGPFLDLLKAFNDELEGADTLTVIGYSFSDPHINVYIGDWLNRSETHLLRVVDPSLAEVPVGRRGTLFSFGLGKRGSTELISETAAAAIASIYG
jgi:hypothetical protein